MKKPLFKKSNVMRQSAEAYNCNCTCGANGSCDCWVTNHPSGQQALRDNNAGPRPQSSTGQQTFSGGWEIR